MAVRPNCSTPRKSRAKTHVADLMSSWVRLVKRCTVHIARPGGRGARSNWTRAPPPTRVSPTSTLQFLTATPFSPLAWTSPVRHVNRFTNCSSSQGPSCSTELLRCSNARVPSPSPHALSFASIPWLGRVKQDRRAWNPRRRNVGQVL